MSSPGTASRLREPGYVEARIRGILASEFPLASAPEDISLDAPLIGKAGLGLDSVSVLQLIGALERTFAIDIHDGEIRVDVVRTVRSLALFVTQKLHSAAHVTVIDRLKALLVSELNLSVQPGALPDDLPLTGRGLGLDSVFILQLVGAIEKQFGIHIADKDISRELFRDIETLARHIADKLDRPPEA